MYLIRPVPICTTAPPVTSTLGVPGQSAPAPRHQLQYRARAVTVVCTCRDAVGAAQQEVVLGTREGVLRRQVSGKKRG